MNNILIFKNRCIKQLKKYSPEILAGTAVVGVVTTTVTACKATLKANDILKEKTEEKGEELTKKEIILAATHCYIPTIFLGGATIGCIVASSIFNKRRYDNAVASFSLAYTTLNSAFKEYKAKVAEVYGEDGEKEIRKSLTKSNYKIEDVAHMVNKFDEDVSLFYDPISKRYFNSTMTDMMYASWELNRKFSTDGEVSLNYYYNVLGLEETDIGYIWGWTWVIHWEMYGHTWIDITFEPTILDDGMVCYILDYSVEPSENYMIY